MLMSCATAVKACFNGSEIDSDSLKGNKAVGI